MHTWKKDLNQRHHHYEELWPGGGFRFNPSSSDNPVNGRLPQSEMIFHLLLPIIIIIIIITNIITIMTRWSRGASRPTGGAASGGETPRLPSSSSASESSPPSPWLWSGSPSPCLWSGSPAPTWLSPSQSLCSTPQDQKMEDLVTQLDSYSRLGIPKVSTSELVICKSCSYRHLPYKPVLPPQIDEVTGKRIPNT